MEQTTRRPSAADYPPPPPRRRSAGSKASVRRRKPKRKRRVWVWVCLVLVLVVAATGVGLGWYVHADNERAAAERAYTALHESYASDDYRSFLERFPDSPYAADVRQRMQQLLQLEREWAYIADSGDAAIFRRFRERHPNPLYDRLCDSKIDSLDWVSAQAGDTWASYDLYMRRHPTGLHYAEATMAQRRCPDPKTVQDSLEAALAAQLGAHNAEVAADSALQD